MFILSSHFIVKRSMGKYKYCAKWGKNNKPWCYTKNNCGEKGNGGSYKYCNESKSCTNSSECGDGTYCHSDLPGCLSKFKDNSYSYNGIDSDNGTPCDKGSYCKPKLEDAEQCHFNSQCGLTNSRQHGGCWSHSLKSNPWTFHDLCNNRASSSHPHKFDKYNYR